MPSGGSTSLDRSREAEVGYEPRTFRSVNSRPTTWGISPPKSCYDTKVPVAKQRNTLIYKLIWLFERLTWNPAESLVCDVLRQLNVLHQAASCFSRYDIRDILINLLKIRRQPTTGFGLPRAHQILSGSIVYVIHTCNTYTWARWPKWLEPEFTGQKVRGSNPTSATRLPLSRLGQPGSIPALVLPSGSMAARHRKDVTAERFLFTYNPLSDKSTRISLSTPRLGQPGSIPALVLPSGGMPARHRKGPRLCRETNLFVSVGIEEGDREKQNLHESVRGIPHGSRLTARTQVLLRLRSPPNARLAKDSGRLPHVYQHTINTTQRTTTNPPLRTTTFPNNALMISPRFVMKRLQSNCPAQRTNQRPSTLPELPTFCSIRTLFMRCYGPEASPARKWPEIRVPCRSSMKASSKWPKVWT
ncbi:hypothetical protein T265_09626 [Opisthorchis viverrini]|uniref:Uncharacterized protein n=1 Tax=Opisthorchis viverrini TaxID=6198 RepID=A0A074ZG62_OPIVI|nr:hypothetical protein T265_09626 [Opisthorchis viverrini]KER22235.1 hypothetical protein T265_09626 [Opisthorchis viverrini]